MSSGQRLANLVSNLLDQSLLNKKKLEVHHDMDVDLYKIAAEVVALAALTAKEDVQVINSVSTDFPIFKSDPARITQIITNLVNVSSCSAVFYTKRYTERYKDTHMSTCQHDPPF